MWNCSRSLAEFPGGRLKPGSRPQTYTLSRFDPKPTFRGQSSSKSPVLQEGARHVVFPLVLAAGCVCFVGSMCCTPGLWIQLQCVYASTLAIVTNVSA